MQQDFPTKENTETADLISVLSQHYYLKIEKKILRICFKKYTDFVTKKKRL